MSQSTPTDEQARRPAAGVRAAGFAGWMARGTILGALGGAAAGIVDHLLSAEAARQFLPDGTARLLVFLVALYGAAGAAAGALLGLLAALLAVGTDVGALWQATFAPGPASEATATPAAGRRAAAYVVGGAVALGLHGAMLYGVALAALLRFHGKFLIAALVGVVAALLALPAVGAAFVAAAALSPLLRFGPRVRPSLRAPLGVMAPAWLAGLGVASLAVLELVAATQQQAARLRVPSLLQALAGDVPHGRAFLIAVRAPLVVVVALALAHLGGRALGALGTFAKRDAGGELRSAWLRFTQRPVGALLLVGGLVGVGGGAALAVEWDIARLLPLRPFVVGGVAAGAALAGLLVGVGASLPARRAPLRVVLVAGLPAVLFALAIQAGRADRVQKAAANNASLAGPILAGIRAAWDLDRDHFSPPLALGPDCDDFDADVHPGAFDWPDDGVDQNCNGHEATLAARPRPPFSAVPDAVPRAPNVLLVSIDALRADHVGAYGYARDTTPRIDALARQSVLFKNSWAPSPSTRYSVPAMLTGRYESTIAWGSPAVHWPPQVLPENRLLAEMFKDHGYHTGALVPAHYFEPTWGLTQGFDDYDNSLAHLHANPFGGDPARATGSSSKELADLGIEWLVKHGKGPAPFFLWMHFYDPHYLYEKHPEVPSFGEQDVDLYDGEIRFTDLHIGRVLDALRAAGRWDDTVIIVTADHGEGFGEHGVKQHGYHIYAQQNKVPFLVKVPGIAARTADEPIGHVDLFPTLLNLLRADDEPQLLGRSFVDLMLGAGDPRLIFQEVDYEGPTSRKAVASRTHQLIANVIPDGTYELYDLTRDPAEEHDLFVRGEGGESARLVAALGQWQDEIALPPDFARRVTGNLSAAPMASTTPLAVTLDPGGGGKLVVDGVDLPAQPVKPGAEVELAVVMHVTDTLPAGWRLYTHARLDGNAAGFLNLDHEPVENFVPLARLRAGQWVRDRMSGSTWWSTL